jgi:hypothetical protein
MDLQVFTKFLICIDIITTKEVHSVPNVGPGPDVIVYSVVVLCGVILVVKRNMEIQFNVDNADLCSIQVGDSRFS